MVSFLPRKLLLLSALALICAQGHGAYAAAPALSFTVNMSEAVIVDTTGGTPTIAVDVDGAPRTASYVSGSGTNALTFAYTATAGDLDMNGIAVTSPITLNNGTIRDLAGNDAALTFAPPDTSSVHVNYPSLSMDFLAGTTGRYTLNGTAYTGASAFSSFLTAAAGTFSRSTTGTYIDSAGTVQTASAHTPRFDYDETTHAAKGLLIEEARTNFVLQSHTYTGGPWTYNRITLTQGQAAPDGSSSAVELVVNGGSDPIFGQQVTTGNPSGKTYTFSFWAKCGTSNAGEACKLYAFTYGTSSGVEQAANVSIDLTSSWQRYSVTRTFPAGMASTVVMFRIDPFDGTGGTQAPSAGSSIYTWGWQVEEAATLSSYIPTGASAITRAADNLIIPTGSWYDQAKGTANTEQSYLSSAGTSYPMFWRFDDTTGSNRWNAYYNQNNGQIGADSYVGGAGQALGGRASTTAATSSKIAIAQASNNARAAFNGTLGALNSSYTPPPITRYVGSIANTGMTKWLRSFSYYPRRASDTQLQLLTQ